MKKICYILLFFLTIILLFKKPNISFNDTKNTLHYYNKKDEWIIDIKKIKLYEPFYDNGNVDQNIIVIHPSEYPNINNSTLILAGHSGNGNNAYFNELYRLVKGDTIFLRNSNYIYKYRIINIYYQKKNGRVNIYKNNDKTNLILITCTNGNSNSQTVYVSELIK